MRREHSRAELVRKLAPYAENREAVEVVLDLLLSKKHQSDERFAEERARSLSRKYGIARIRRDLKAKGVDQDVIDRISTEGELERAQAILRRKYREPAATRKERARRARFLLGRGFSRDVARRLLGASSPDNENE